MFWLHPLLLLLGTLILVRFFSPGDKTEGVLAFFTLSAAVIILTAEFLSFFELLNSQSAWAGSGVIFFVSVVALQIKNQSESLFRLDSIRFPSVKALKNWIGGLSLFEKSTLLPLLVLILLVGLSQLILIFLVAPGNHDSMTTHLARVAYYVQHGSYAFFEANTWGQVIHPRNSTSLLLYFYLHTGSEDVTQLVHFGSYWVLLISVYGVSRRAELSRNQALFSALSAGLLTSLIMQATTTQNDLMVAALIGTVVCFLLSYKRDRSKKYLLLVTIATAISLGIKASVVLALMPIAMIGVWVLVEKDTQKTVRTFGFTAASFLMSVLLFTLPAGYISNLQNFGHPLGPDIVRTSHTFEGESVDFRFRNGVRNTLRYSIEFLSLDGFPTISPVRMAQKTVRGYNKRVLERDVIQPVYVPGEISDPETRFVRYTGSNPFILFLMDREGARSPFNYFKMPAANEDFSYWGVMGFALAWVMLFYSLFSKNSNSTLKLLGWSALLFLLLQAFSGPYDPWRGRYFSIAVVFVLPSAGLAISFVNSWIRGYVLIIVAAGMISAVSTLFLKAGHISETESGYTYSFWFSESRLAQLTRKRLYYEPLKQFESLVPVDAHVALFLPTDSIEFPLFGKNQTRHLYPVNSFFSGPGSIPSEASYLLYYDQYPCADPINDLHLGADWYLRMLHDENRTCADQRESVSEMSEEF